MKDIAGDISTIFKPAPITGPENRLFKKFAAQMKKMPFFPLVDGGKQKLQPIWIRDVALAVYVICTNALQTYDFLGQTYHLAGPDVFAMKELAYFSFNTITETPNTLSFPLSAAKALSGPGDWLQPANWQPIALLGFALGACLRMLSRRHALI